MPSMVTLTSRAFSFIAPLMRRGSASGFFMRGRPEGGAPRGGPKWRKGRERGERTPPARSRLRVGAAHPLVDGDAQLHRLGAGAVCEPLGGQQRVLHRELGHAAL